MKRGILVRSAIVAAVIVLQGAAARAATVNVDVGPNGSMSFSPDSVSINVGDTVQWTWKSSPHSVTAGSPGNQTGQFDSGLQNSPHTFTHTFSNAGDFPYFCTFHGAIMSGIVQVAAVASPTPTATATATATATPTATPTPTPLLPRIGKGPIRIELQPVATGLSAPVDFISANDSTGRMFIVNQTGQILVLKNGQVLATPFLDVSSRLVALMAGYDERGLLGLAFHPGFADSGSPGFHKLYTYTSEPVTGAADFTVPNPNAFNCQSVIAEWQVSAGNPDVVDPATRREIMRIDHPEFNHNAGQLVFRPSDHYLYISLGDGGAANDVGDGHDPSTGNGQKLTTVLGKVLRIDPLVPSAEPTSTDPWDPLESTCRHASLSIL